ncbi:sulfatase-like hydrolase/transferase [Coraliomargarita sp. W4R72]
MKNINIKQFGLILFLVCLCGYCCAADYIVATGEVTSVRLGKVSTFYRFKTTDGREYVANSAWAQVAQNSERLQEAYDSGERIVIEFSPHAKFPDASIWKIKRIESVTDFSNSSNVKWGIPSAGEPRASFGQSIEQSIASNSRSDRPNVLLIISDDQGSGDFGFMGNETVKTPNIDQLASESAFFRRFIVAPACSPTRASVMTGRNHMKTGVWGVGDRNNFMRDETIMPQFFKDAGYHTGYFGKRDGTYSVELEAWHRGCDEVTHVTGYQHQDPLTFTHQGVVKRTGWTCDLDTAAALDFIDRQGEEAWWVAVPYLLPHLPWVAPPEFVQPYLEEGCSPKLANVYGCITQMDAAIGKLLEGVEKLGHGDNTIVIFMSDNGPSYKGMSEADIVSRNPLGLKGSKAFAWENGIVVPLLAKWPGKIPAGERTQFATVEDLLPTLLDLAKISPSTWPEYRPFDGISLRTAFEDPTAASVDREVFRVAISGDGQAGGGRWVVNEPKSVTLAEQHTVLCGPRFKLHNLPGGEVALFDLQHDVGEIHDVSHEFPEILQRYTAEMERQYAEIQDSGRSYQMSKVKVGKKAFRYNKINASLLRRVFGSIEPIPPLGIRGFTSPDDRAEYAIIVEDPGLYRVEVVGSHLNSGNGWILDVGADSVPLLDLSSEKIVFGPFELRYSGEAEVALSVAGHSSMSTEAEVKSILFSRVEDM